MAEKCGHIKANILQISWQITADFGGMGEGVESILISLLDKMMEHKSRLCSIPDPSRKRKTGLQGKWLNPWCTGTYGALAGRKISLKSRIGSKN